MAGFLQGLGLAAGRNILVGQEMSQKQSLIDERNVQTAQARQQMAMLAQQQQTQKEVGQYVSSEIDKDRSVITDPIKSAQLFENAAGMALRSGDFTSAGKMSDLAKAKLQEAKEAAAAQAAQMQLKKEDLANEAFSFAAAPTQEGYQALVKKAVAAGVNPTTIPNPSSPKFAAWVNEQELASKTASERANFVQKAAEQDQNRREKQREFDLRRQDQQIQRSQIAVLRESAAEDRKQRLQLAKDEFEYRKQHSQDITTSRGPAVKDISGKQYQYDPSGKLEGTRDLPDSNWVQIGEKMTSQQKTGVSRGSYAAAEVARSLSTAMKFDPGTTVGPFAHLGAHTPLEALTKVGANALTPAQFQAMNVNAAGLGNQIASLEAALGGRMAAGTQQQHLQDMAIPQPADSGYTAAYKLANAKELTITALKHLPGHFAKTEEGKAQIKELEDSIPFSTSDVITAMQKDPGGKKSANAIRQLQHDSEIAKGNISTAAAGIGGGGSPVPSAAPAGASVPGIPALPAGFTLDK